MQHFEEPAEEWLSGLRSKLGLGSQPRYETPITVGPKNKKHSD